MNTSSPTPSIDLRRATAEQREAILAEGRPLLVEAGAGTGKTWVLVQRFLRLLDDHRDWPIDSIIAITFTEKAAREMRTRIRDEIERVAESAQPDSHWWQRRRDLDHLMVSTIHGLCARILRENAIAAGLDPSFTVLDEQESDLLKQEAIEQALAQLVGNDDPALALLAGLHLGDLRQELAQLMAKRGTLHERFAQLEEGEALLERWRRGVVARRQGLWQEQLAHVPGLVPALAHLPTVRIRDEDDALVPSLRAAQQGCELVAQQQFVPAAQAFSSIRLVGGKQASWGGKGELTRLKDMLSAVREAGRALLEAGCDQEVGPADEQAIAALALWQRVWEAVGAIYEQLKAARQALDFDDLEILTDRLLRAPHAERLQAFLAGIRQVMVDEGQDINEVQQRLIYALAPASSGGALFVVGDAKQSIYRFRQAQVSVFNRVSRDIQSATGFPPLRLSRSLRSSQPLVAAINAAFDFLFRPFAGDYEDYEARPAPLSAHRPEADVPAAAPVELLLIPGKDEADENVDAETARVWEGRWLAERLLALQESRFPVWDRQARAYRPFRFGDAAVLFRATTVLPIYEEQFRAYGLPYLTTSGRGYYDRPEVQDLIALLAALQDPTDDLSLATALRSPLFDLSDETLVYLRWSTPSGPSPEPIPLWRALGDPPATAQKEAVARAGAILQQLWQEVGRGSVWRLLRLALDLTDYQAFLAMAGGQDRDSGRPSANLSKLMSQALEHGSASLSAFLGRINSLRAREAREGEAQVGAPESGALQLMSIHAAKGLEFPVVAIADLGRSDARNNASARLLHDPAFGLACMWRDEAGNWSKPAGYLWAEWLEERMQRAESKRLLYVACTRAADLLLLTGRLGGSDSWLQSLMDAWQIAAPGTERESCERDGFRLLVHRPRRAPEERQQPAARRAAAGPQQADTRLARPLPAAPRRLHASITELQSVLDQALSQAQAPDPLAAWEREVLPGAALVAATGRVVHRALADWHCLALSPVELYRRLEAWAGREPGLSPADAAGVASHCLAMLRRLKRHSLYQEICQASKRYAELPFDLRLGEHLFRGAIDLVFQAGDGSWHLIDWKSENVGRVSEAASQRHRLQLAAYALAARQATGAIPAAALCFLRPQVTLVPYGHAELESAWEASLRQLRSCPG